MPEALAVIFVGAVCIIAWVGAWLQARNPALHDLRQEFTRLQQQHAWLQQRLERAERERWGDQMVAGIAAELRSTRERLARAQA